MEKLLLRVGEAIEITGLGRTKLYELIGSGEIPSVRVGSAVRIPVSALRDWVERKSRPCERELSGTAA